MSSKVRLPQRAVAGVLVLMSSLMLQSVSSLWDRMTERNDGVDEAPFENGECERDNRLKKLTPGFLLPWFRSASLNATRRSLILSPTLISYMWRQFPVATKMLIDRLHICVKCQRSNKHAWRIACSHSQARHCIYHVVPYFTMLGEFRKVEGKFMTLATNASFLRRFSLPMKKIFSSGMGAAGAVKPSNGR